MVSGPTRPPRSSKTARESSASGLISVIRTLSSSQDNDDRDREKSRLEKEFKRSDQRLDLLIESQRDALTKAMQDFNKISSRITSSRDRIKQVKQKLQTAQVLLQCKRDELRRLWLESVEHSHVLHLLEQIEGLNSVPHKLDNNISLARYLQATKDLMKSVALLEGELSGVDALREVKDNLQQQKEQLHETLMTELQRHLYEEVSRDCLDAFRRSGKIPNSKAEHVATHRLLVSIEDAELLKLEKIAGSERRLDSERQIVILVRCLVLLAKISESVEMIRERCQGHLFHAVSRTTTAVLEGGEGPERLLQLLELIFAQFLIIEQRHQLVLSHLSPHVVSEYDEEGNPIPLLYSMEDISSKMQHVLTTLLNTYLGATGGRQEVHGGFGTSAGDNMDVNLFFLRKRPFVTTVNPTKQRKFTLFKFDNSQLAISKSSYLQEQQQQGSNGVVIEKSTDQGAALGPTPSPSAPGGTAGGTGLWEQVVCKPSFKNISYMYRPMLRFVERLDDAERSPLQIVLTAAVKEFLAMVNDELQTVVEQSAKSLEEFRVVTDAEVLKSLKTTRPVLQSCVAIDGILQVLKEHANDLPQFASEFVEKACDVMRRYKDIAEHTYRTIVPPQEVRQTNSNHWISDPDICRCLMGLPNWINLIDDVEHEELEESPEDIRLRNQQEVSILLSNLGQKKDIPSTEIFSNVNDLKMVAHMHEGLEWLSIRTQEMCDALKCGKDNPAEDNNLSEALRKLKEFATDLQEKANTCLLLLHLEVRVHCFYYLLPLVAEGHFTTAVGSLGGGSTNSPDVAHGGGHGTQDTDRQVLDLAADLSRIEEALSNAVQPRKHKYVFEGLGLVIAVILMNAVPQIHRINELGVKRICRDIYAIQQKLTTISAGREVSLDHACQYFALMLLSGQDILNGIVENGPQFQQIDYKNLFELLCRSRPDEKDKVEWYNNRLKDILDGVPVKI